jgi:hypothetical protein
MRRLLTGIKNRFSLDESVSAATGEPVRADSAMNPPGAESMTPG